MPTYEYACKACGEHVEVVQSFKDEPLTECPACGGALRKVFAPVGIVLKGSGFYKTDSRSAAGSAKGPKKEATSEPSSSSESKGSSSSSESTSTDTSKATDRKTEKKTESKSA
ncbi:MAG: FmdB family transcriptional regulator [Acidimicrobiia bacterium]|nr:FmdB family transcriptional regulator [Acidimicrobiia bacterium]